MKQRLWNQRLLIFALTSVVFLSGCAQPAPPAPTPPSGGPTSTPAWMNIELTDVATGQKFKISDFKGKPILLESFAVWCPTCLGQQKELSKLKGDDLVHISLDTDPNEDEAKIRGHLERYGFDWYFAVSPIELTQALIDDFSLRIVSAPSVPVVLICANQSTRLLRSGIKSAEELRGEIEKGCP